ncbi:cytochrome b5 domain-containing protein 1 isoform X2 [Parambassis ranga]|uniref:Cytochrome b5 domain-containing protein 1 n=1 Tax=Parambassis ranga TaxID=210632 RepID=A0A6P7I2D6_9TELE|nr:cytochrome b5 domain-containing protein 1 isoform X2 [Parambassis ranga]
MEKINKNVYFADVINLWKPRPKLHVPRCHGNAATTAHRMDLQSRSMSDHPAAAPCPQDMKRPRYFTPAEVAAHNTAADLWVSYLGKVCDLTPLVNRYTGDALLLPIMECAGKDISSWFDPETQDLLTFVDPLTNCVTYFTPRGRFVHVPPNGPRSDWAMVIGEPWWKDPRYQVGRLSAKSRWIRVINTLTSQEQRLQVCSEETLEEILQRYLRYNGHAHSYTWKFGGACLDMSRTLGENSVPDDDRQLEQLRLDQDLYTPAILLHFNDDLTED